MARDESNSSWGGLTAWQVGRKVEVGGWSEKGRDGGEGKMEGEGGRRWKVEWEEGERRRRGKEREGKGREEIKGKGERSEV